MISGDFIVEIVVERPGRQRKPFLDQLEAKPETGCWNFTGSLDRDGYGILSVDGRSWRAHRFAYERFVGPIPHGLLVLHSCHNPACCNPSHLRPGTDRDNVRDAIASNRRVAPNQKLTLNQVAAIKNSPATAVELGARFGVTAKAIRDVWSGRTFTAKGVNYGAVQ